MSRVTPDEMLALVEDVLGEGVMLARCLEHPMEAYRAERVLRTVWREIVMRLEQRDPALIAGLRKR